MMCRPEEVRKVQAMIAEGCAPLESCLTVDLVGCSRALLEVVASGAVQTVQDVDRFVRCTLMCQTKPFQEVNYPPHYAPIIPQYHSLKQSSP